MKKSIVFVVIALLLVAGYFGYNQYTIIKNNADEQVSIDAIQGLDDIKNLLPSFDGYAIISAEDALQLVSEQVDISDFNISLSTHIFREGEDEYYLFDVIKKAGPSFAQQIAVNTTTGEMLSFSPEEQKLSSMTEFPIETPIAKQQEWSGEFVNKEKTYILQLLQADSNSFEFVFYDNSKAEISNVIVQTSQRADNDDDDDDDDDDNDSDDDNDDDDEEPKNKPNINQNNNTNNNYAARTTIISGIGRVDGSIAKYETDNVEILFKKQDSIVTVNIISKNEKIVKVAGEYKLK